MSCGNSTCLKSKVSGDDLGRSCAKMGPKREPREANIEVGRVFFSCLKRYAYNNMFLNAFLIDLGPPWGSKSEHFAWEGLQKSDFKEVGW